MHRTITKTVSMFLVAVMVMGIAVMPMRANAVIYDLIPDIKSTYWDDVVAAILFLAEGMAKSTTTSDAEAAASRFSAYFSPEVKNPIAVTRDQMNALSKHLIQYGIKVMPGVVPGSPYMALMIQDTWVTTPTGSVQLDVDIGDMYFYDGRTILCNPGGSAAEEDRDSFDNTTSTNTQVGVNPDGGLTDFDEQVKDSGSTTNGPYLNFTTNNSWQMKNEIGQYTDIENLFYNPITQTYDVTFTDNRHYTYQFYYDYTYITYIGSSAEYREAYKVYYELPDGRSSGDLTADELKGLSLQFDMVNYDKVASDTLTQALFPFDGSLDNESYYNASADWVVGSSIEYLESPDGFGGCLYYPSNTTSRLDFNLADSFTVGQDWSVQFRIYFNGAMNQPLYFTVNGIPDWLTGSGRLSSSYSKNSSYTYQNNGFPLLVIFNNRIQFLNNHVYDDLTSGTFTSSSNSTFSFVEGQWYDICICSVPVTSVPSQPYNTNTLWFYVNGNLVASYYVPENGYSAANQSNVSTGFFCFGPGLTYLDYNRITNYKSGTNYYVGFYSSNVSRPALMMAEVNSFSFISNGSGGSTCLIDNLRIVSTALYTGVDSFTPTPVPFDTNLVYVLPSVSELNDNTVAIMSQLPVSGYRVGGIRPTDPTLATGYVYMHIDGEFVDSVQQWNGAYWEEVTARLYTGIRWIPVTAFNVYTLEDMFDIIDPDADGGGNTVDDIYQYYLWWSGEWGNFQTWLQGTMQTLIEVIQASNGGGGGGSNAPVVIVPGYNDQTTTSEIITENPDGSTTKTVIVSNAAGLVYSNSVTTYPTDAEGNTKTVTVYTDSSGVMYQTTTIIDKDGNVTVTEPTQATGTLGSILKMITSGVMSIAGTVIEGFVTIVVDGVKFIIDSADKVLSGMGDLITQAAGSIQDLVDSVSPNIDTGSEEVLDSTVESVGFLDGVLMIYPSQFRNAFTAMVLIGVSLGLLALFIL